MSRINIESAQKSLAESTERLRIRNDALAAYLSVKESSFTRVANAPESNLEEATERAKRYWDELEGKP